MIKSKNQFPWLSEPNIEKQSAQTYDDNGHRKPLFQFKFVWFSHGE
ncbi:hypothetical protein M7I_8232 [Glarea lozoyensis 74030]|uniref:Uncharacterized protein n=1 Tax=Glarea lozoyensis (strain ATCC 74030 / MF5533) TaxID=1104152 RepID=H0EZG5_GLAL7|nr:hypothetical protein M7I_8232 [Glarea lozoyensis 74030]